MNKRKTISNTKYSKYLSKETDRSEVLRRFVRHNNFFGLGEEAVEAMVSELMRYEKMERNAGGKGDTTTRSTDDLKDFLRAKIENPNDDTSRELAPYKTFRINQELLEKNTETVLQILLSDAYTDKTARQEGINNAAGYYPQHLEKLRDILTRAKNKLAEIALKYAVLKNVKRPSKNSKTHHYELYVAKLIDQGLQNTTIAIRIHRASAAGKIIIPKSAEIANIAEWQKTKGVSRANSERHLNERDPARIFFRLGTENDFREAIQSIAFNRDDISMVLHKQLSPIQQLALHEWFATPEPSTFRELGLISDNGEWCEEGFQRLIILLSWTKEYFVPSIEVIRLCTSGYVSFFGGTLRKKEIPFDWILCNDRLTEEQKQNSRELVGQLLKPRYDGKAPSIGKMISAKDVLYLRKVAQKPNFQCVPKEGHESWFRYEIDISALNYVRNASRWFVSKEGSDGLDYMTVIVVLSLITPAVRIVPRDR